MVRHSCKPEWLVFKTGWTHNESRALTLSSADRSELHERANESAIIHFLVLDRPGEAKTCVPRVPAAGERRFREPRAHNKRNSLNDQMNNIIKTDRMCVSLKLCIYRYDNNVSASINGRSYATRTKTERVINNAKVISFNIMYIK